MLNFQKYLTMKKIFNIVALSAIILSCNKKAEETKVIKSDSVVTNEVDIPDSLQISSFCYLAANNKDSVFVSYDDNLGTVVGKMFYKNYQKDSSFGDIIGTADGDTLKLDYTFQSEGLMSSREIWFLKKNGELHEGIGEMDKSSGSKYADYKKLNFEGGNILKQADYNLVNKQLAKIPTAPTAQPAQEEKPRAVPIKKVEKTEENTKKKLTQEKDSEVKKEAKPKTTEKTEAKKTESKKTEVKKTEKEVTTEKISSKKPAENKKAEATKK